MKITEARRVSYSIPVLNAFGNEMGRKEDTVEVPNDKVHLRNIDVGYGWPPEYKNVPHGERTIRVVCLDASLENGVVEAKIEDSNGVYNIQLKTRDRKGVGKEVDGARLKVLPL